MANKIKPKRSYTTNAAPTTADLEVNELAINWADGIAYTKDSSGQIVSLTMGGGGGSAAPDSRWDLFLPAAPTSLAAAAGNSQAVLTWTAPTVLSQTPITDYVVQYSANGGTSWSTFADGTSATASATVTGLTNGTEYTFRVAAVTGVGQGAWSATVTATPVAAQSDALFGQVSLLLHMEGSNGSTSFVDSSPTQQSSTASGVSIATDIKKFGDSSGSFGFGYLDGFAGVDLSSGSYTVEGWFYTENNSEGDNMNVLAGNFANYPSRWVLDIGVGGGLAYPRIITESNAVLSTYSAPYTTGTWAHVAWVNDATADTLSVYWNGSRIGQRSAVSLAKYATMQIGKGGGSYVARAYRLDEIRITKAARYSGATIDVPTAAFPEAPAGTVFISTQPPASLSIGGSSGSITAAALVYGGGVATWQWQRSTDNGVTWTNVSGATSATLSLTGQTSANDGDRYRAIASNSGGTSSATSTSTTVSILSSAFSAKPASWTGAGFAADPVLSADALGHPWPAGSFRTGSLTAAIGGTLRITGTADGGGDCNYTMINLNGYEWLYFAECDPPAINITYTVAAGDVISFDAAGTFRNVSLWIVP